MERSRVIVGDDEPGVRAIVRDALVLSGWSVDAVADGDELIRRYRPGAHRLVIVDFLMPGPNGLDVIAELRGRGEKVPIILMSGSGSPDRLQASALNYRVEFLRKPFGIAALRSAVRRFSHPEDR